MDLDRYCARVAYTGDLTPTRAVLDALHLAHATQIPFENLDILLRRPVSLDLDRLQEKLVAGGRGGYCFEQNTLFAAVLREVGFAVTLLAARVRYRTRQVLPRTHMLLLVDLDGERCIADVGFGADGLLLPVPLTPGQQARQFAWTYRLADDAGLYVLQSRRDGVWNDLYAFTLEPQYPIDFEMANYYTSTHPVSRFTQSLIVQKLATRARTTLRNRDLIVDTGETVTTRTLQDDDEILRALAETFDLRFPAGTRFPVREDVF